MLEYGTLGQIAAQVGRHVQDTSSGGLVRIKEEINMHYASIARGHRWPGLLRVSEEKASLTVGQKYLYLPLEVEQVYLIFPQNGMPPLEGRSLDQLIQQHSTNYSTSGSTISFAEAGEVGYRTDFYETGEALLITSNSSSPIIGLVHGMVSGREGEVAAVEQLETITIAPSVGVTTTNTWKDLIGVSVDDLPTGIYVTVTGATSSRVYATISAGQRTAKYKRIRLMQPAGTPDTYTLVWKKRVLRLIEDHQPVEIPVGQVLVDFTVSTFFSSQREYQAATLHYQAALGALESLKQAVSVDGAIVHQAIPAVSLRRGYQSGGWVG